MAKQNDKEEMGFRFLEDKIDEALLRARRLFFSGPVDDETARDAIRKLWYLELTDPGKPILFVINSPGGSIDSGFAIWDQVKMVSSPVTTLVTGLAASMGSVLSLSAAPGRRFATKYARIMIHQPSIGGVMRGQATDLDIQAKEMLKTRSMLVALYTSATGKAESVVEKAIDRDTWMSAEEAKHFGLLDRVISSYTEL